MKFKTAYDCDHDRPTQEFSKFEPQYRMEFNPDTMQDELVEVGHVNLDVLKHEAARECNIYNQIDRYNRTGDDSFLGTVVPGFIDATAWPKSFMEVKNIEAKANQLWAQAPIDVRKKYGDNFAVFMNELDTQLAAKAKADIEAKRAAAQGNPTGGDVNA